MDLNDLLVSYKRIETPSRVVPTFQLIQPDIPYRDAPSQDSPRPQQVVTEPATTSYSISLSQVKAPGFQMKWNSPYKNRNTWVTDLAAAYRKAGVTNDNAIKMLIAQDAQESSWGRSAQGKFNFGNLTTGAKWKGDYVRGNDHDAKGNPIKQKFRSYNSMDEYAADKLQFLKNLYDFDENDDINTFTAKLTGKNKGKRRYAEATDYADRVAAVFRSFKDGGIIKYQQAGKVLSPPEKARQNLSSKFPVNWENSDWLHNYFSKNLGYNTSLSILSSILPESGADPHKKQLRGGPGRGLVQWGFGTDRYNHMKSYKMRGPVQKGIDPELQRQAEYIVNTVKNEQKTGDGIMEEQGLIQKC